MPFYTESTYHDRQMVQNLSTQTVTLAEGWKVIDLGEIPNHIEILNLNQPADYRSESILLLEASVANMAVSFQLVINGTPAGSIRTAVLKSNNDPGNFVFIGDTDAFIAGDLITGRWMTDKGTATMSELTIEIHGIALSRIVT